MALVKLLVLMACVVSANCIPTPFGLGRNCHIDHFQLQEDFSLERFMGTWFVVAHVQRTDYPYQRRSHYGLRQNGTVSMKTNRVVRPGDCNPWHFEATGTINDDAGHPAKMLLYPPMTNYPPEDYWVVSTDYTSYALVYNCGRQRTDGSCTKRGEHAWLMGRTTGQLPPETRSLISDILWTLCISPERLRDVPLDCESELTHSKPHVTADSANCQDDEQGNCSKGALTGVQEVLGDSAGPGIHNPCEISTFELQSNFIVEKFLGEWYEIAHSRAPGSTLKLPDMRSMLFSRGAADREADMDLLMKDIKLDGQCANMDTPGSGWLSRDNPAKFIVEFPIPQGYGVSGPVEYWILATDYTSYAVTYSCHHMYEDGTCDKQREALWVLSRTPTLPGGVQRQVDEVIGGVCLEPLKVTENQDMCYTTDLGDSNQTLVVVKGRAAVTSGCDLATAKYGCCLLNNRPATGPNYQGCPRLRPPVAGQDIEMRPVSEVVRPQPVALALVAPQPLKVKTVECDEKIICKIYCEYGFKKDENNCDVCQCALEPLEATSGSFLREAAGKTKLVSCLHQTSPKLGLPRLDCEEDGSFAQVQCHGGECWCVDQTTGYELKRTRVSHDEKPDCDQAPTPRKMVMTGSKMTSDCRARRQEAESSLNWLEGSGSLYLPVCDERGLYEPVQCYLESDVCWCVDTLTGEQVGGSTVQGMPLCAP